MSASLQRKGPLPAVCPQHHMQASWMPLTSPPALCFGLYKFRGGFGSPAAPPAEMSPGPLLKSYPPQLAVMRRGPRVNTPNRGIERSLLFYPSSPACKRESGNTFTSSCLVKVCSCCWISCSRAVRQASSSKLDASCCRRAKLLRVEQNKEGQRLNFASFWFNRLYRVGVEIRKNAKFRNKIKWNREKKPVLY